MIGMVLVTHGNLALEFRSALEHVVGKQDALDVICIGPDDDMEARRDDIMNAIEQVNAGDGVVVLTDMFGGTPSNLAISVMQTGKVEVVAGVNLPMLVKIASLRKEGAYDRGGDGLFHVVEQAREAGRKYINVASQVLAGEGA